MQQLDTSFTVTPVGNQAGTYTGRNKRRRMFV